MWNRTNGFEIEPTDLKSMWNRTNGFEIDVKSNQRLISFFNKNFGLNEWIEHLIRGALCELLCWFTHQRIPRIKNYFIAFLYYFTTLPLVPVSNNWRNKPDFTMWRFLCDLLLIVGKLGPIVTVEVEVLDRLNLNFWACVIHFHICYPKHY